MVTVFFKKTIKFSENGFNYGDETRMFFDSETDALRFWEKETENFGTALDLLVGDECQCDYNGEYDYETKVYTFGVKNSKLMYMCMEIVEDKEDVFYCEDNGRTVLSASWNKVA